MISKTQRGLSKGSITEINTAFNALTRFKATVYRIYGTPNCNTPNKKSPTQSVTAEDELKKVKQKGKPMKAVKTFPNRTDSMGDPPFCLRKNMVTAAKLIPEPMANKFP